MKVIVCSFLVLVLFSACVEDTDTAVETTDVLVDTDRADHTGEIRLRADNLTIWLRPDIETVDGSGAYWSFRGRTSRNLDHVAGFVGLASVNVEQLSKRKFEVRIPADVLEPAIISGLFVQTETSAGTHTLRVELSPRFDKGEGSSYIYPYKNVELIAVDGSPVFRGTVSTRKDFDWIEGWNDDDSEPTSTKFNDRKFFLDFDQGRLTWASHPYTDALYVTGEAENGKRYRREVHIGMSVIGLGLTNGDPYLEWPPAECDKTGDVRELLACGPD